MLETFVLAPRLCRNRRIRGLYYTSNNPFDREGFINNEQTASKGNMEAGSGKTSTSLHLGSERPWALALALAWASAMVPALELASPRSWVVERLGRKKKNTRR